MKVVAIVQARMSSTRLPGKVLAPIGVLTMIDRMLGQVRASRRVDQVVVATSVDPSDDPLVAHLSAAGVDVIRGALDDVLARFAEAAEQTGADVLVRLTGDCPLHTPDTIDEVVDAFLAASVDYAANIDPYTRPDGQDVEVFSRAALARTLAGAAPGPEREHVTTWLRTAGEISRLAVRHVAHPGAADLRWTVDTDSDLGYVRLVWAELDRRGPGPHAYEDVMQAVTAVAPPTHEDIPNRGYYTSLFAKASGTRAAPLVIRESEALLARSERVIPGGAQTYSKSWKQHLRGVSPVFLERGAGAIVWDADGNEYVDLVQGLLPNILGYAHPAVDAAVAARCREGHSFSLAHRLEVELAERLTGIIPCAEMVRFGKNGSDATAGAVRISRAWTGRERIACCGYHGWQDWYIGVTSRHIGVPEAVRSLTHAFPYNDLPALERLLAAHPSEFAAVIMEPLNFTMPNPGYLEGVQELARRHGAVLIFDEICTGFHMGLGGAQRRFGVIPDLATFGKAMGNGYPISCVVGRRDIMRTFEDAFVSFTFAGDVGALAAAQAVLDVLEQTDALERIETAGRRLRDGALALAGAAGLGARFSTMGLPAWVLLRFLDANGADDPVLRALWLQEVTRRGVLLISTHNTCAALGPAEVDRVLVAYAEAFKCVGAEIRKGTDLGTLLDAPVPTPAFKARG
ncbi:MAG: aminotransferase class III-fold pyridoxal phosphate-dependent enzyme [Gemmatimonadales bacterium]